MLKKISELFCYRDGRLNAVKIWLHIGNLTATGIVIRLAWENALSVDFFIAYMAIVTGASIANKYLNKDKAVATEMISGVSKVPSISIAQSDYTNK